MDEKVLVKRIFDFLFCCISEEEREMVYTAAINHNSRAVYEAQKNLLREKHGYRCSICGKFYPYIEIDYENAQVDLKKCDRLRLRFSGGGNLCSALYCKSP